jgi:cellulose synthase/poly-beta-1,6-N-acetylglucosamine synthase-like glycosyltransferase
MISVIISYCNNDLKFIEENIKEVKKFSNDIVISYCRKSFDGKQEEEQKLEEMFQLAKGCKLVEIEYTENKHPKYHHNLMRFAGLQETKEKYVLFLDADEIIEGDLFKQYLDEFDYLMYDVVAFKCYWYFRDKKYRAKQTEQAAVLCIKRICTEDYIFSNSERWEFYNRNGLRIKTEETFRNNILCHHYSWVRDKEEMIKKVSCWGHKGERDWVSLIEEEFSRKFNGKDFVHNYDYDIIL